MRKAVLIAVGIAAAGFAAALADEPNFKLGNSNAPIEYSASECTAEQAKGSKEMTLVCTGNVMVHQGDVRLRADSMRIHSPDGHSADRIVAQGRVVIDAPSGTATGDVGTYDIAPRIVILQGRVVLARGDNVMRGDTLHVDLISGVAKISGGKTGGRFQGMFTPKSSDDGKK